MTRVDDAREIERVAVGVPLFSANLITELAKAAARSPAFDLGAVIALARRLILLARTAVGITQNGIFQFELVNYAKNFLIQAVQFLVVVGVMYQNLDRVHQAAGGSHTLDNAVKNVINALRKLVFALHSATEQELQQKRLLRGLMGELDRRSGAGTAHADVLPPGPPDTASLRTDPTPALLSELAALKAAASVMPQQQQSTAGRPSTLQANDKEPGGGGGAVLPNGLLVKKTSNKQLEVIRAPKKRGSVLTKRLSVMVQREKNGLAAPMLPPGVTLTPATPQASSSAQSTDPQSVSSNTTSARSSGPGTPGSVTSSSSADSSSSVAIQLDLRLPPKLNLAALLPPPTATTNTIAAKGSSLRRSARTGAGASAIHSPRMSFQKLIQSVAADCRELLLAVRVPMDEFKTHNQQRFQLLVDGLLANHKLAIDKVASKLGEGEIMKHNLVSSAKLDLAANDVVQARVAAQFSSAVRALTNSLKDFLAAIKACTKALSSHSSSTPAAASEPPQKPSSSSNYTILPLPQQAGAGALSDRRMSNPPLPLSLPSSRPDTRATSPVVSPRVAKYSPLQVFSQHTKDLTLAFRQADSPTSFYEQFDFEVITALFKSVQRLLASPSFPDPKAKKKCLEETKRMLGYARQLRTAMETHQFQSFRKAKNAFLTCLKQLLQNIVTGMKHHSGGLPRSVTS